MLVAAVLIATIAYQAGLSHPPTIWKESANLSLECVFNTPYFKLKGSTQQFPGHCFYGFMFLNTTGFLICCYNMDNLVVQVQGSKTTRCIYLDAAIQLHRVDHPLYPQILYHHWLCSYILLLSYWFSFFSSFDLLYTKGHECQDKEGSWCQTRFVNATSHVTKASPSALYRYISSTFVFVLILWH